MRRIRGRQVSERTDKLLSATGCLIYLVAAVMLLAVFISRWGRIFS